MNASLTLPAAGEAPDMAVEHDELLTTAELAECTCPDWCERDHDRD